MTKVTEHDVVNFLREKVAQLTKELESAQGALIAFQASASVNEAPSVAKAKRVGTAVSRKSGKTGAAKRGRKPQLEEFPSERLINADQLG
jgi:hypothetical protein